MRYLHLCSFILVAVLLSACGGTPAPDETVAALPTLAALPTNTATWTPPPPSATTPATWTPTATFTLEPTITVSATPSITPSVTITDTPSPTFTFEPTVTLEIRPLTGLLDLALQTTILPDDFEVPDYEGIDVPLEVIQLTAAAGAVDEPLTFSSETGQAAEGGCPAPDEQFATAYYSNPAVADAIGCPAGNPPQAITIQGAWQDFENGKMLWLNDGSNIIHVLRGSGESATWDRFADTYVDGVDPETYDPAPEGFFSPIRGFGKVWSSNDSVEDSLNWGITGETGDAFAVLQEFRNGRMVYFPTRGDIIVLIAATDGSSRWVILD